MGLRQGRAQLTSPALHPHSIHPVLRHGHHNDDQRTKVFYLEGWQALADANCIFGFDGWQRETIAVQCVAELESNFYSSNRAGHGIDTDLG
jgi:recombination DNA repair RAD52 pathway protein